MYEYFLVTAYEVKGNCKERFGTCRCKIHRNWRCCKIIKKFILNRPFSFFHFFFKMERITRISTSNRENFQNNFTFHHSRKKSGIFKQMKSKKKGNPRTDKNKEKMIVKFRKIYTSMSTCFDRIVVTSETETENELRKLARSEKRSTILQENEALTNRSFQLTSRPFVIRCIQDRSMLFSRNAPNLES